MTEYVKFILNGCDISFIATAPKDISSCTISQAGVGREGAEEHARHLWNERAET